MAGRRLRLTPAHLHVLLLLAEGPRHGYGLLGGVAERSGGRIELGPSSLYYTLGRLEDAGLIRETEAPGSPEDAVPHEEQRRYYELTGSGRERLAREVELLDDIVEHARRIGLEAGGPS